MNYSIHTRSILIEQDSKTVAGFIGQTPNLPLWTSFFVGVGEIVDDYYSVETKMGAARTRIKLESSKDGIEQFLIQSQIGDQEETARIDLVSTNQSTAVTLHMGLPEKLPLEKVEQMLDGLQSELHRLKDLLESTKY
jgi:hypothetical protein